MKFLVKPEAVVKNVSKCGIQSGKCGIQSGKACGKQIGKCGVQSGRI